MRYSLKKNKELVLNQHLFHRTLKRLVAQNGTSVYNEDRKRARKVADHYMRLYHIDGSIVKSFWYNYAVCVLIGKAV